MRSIPPLFILRKLISPKIADFVSFSRKFWPAAGEKKSGFTVQNGIKTVFLARRRRENLGVLISPKVNSSRINFSNLNFAVKGGGN